MKTISRTIKVFTYVFGKVDMKTAAVADMEKIETATPLTNSRMKEITKETGKMCIHKEASEEKFAMPVDDFIRLCREFAVNSEDNEEYNPDEINEEE